MRRADEILAAYGNHQAQGKRYLLRCLERQPVNLDSAGFLEFLREEEEADAADLARLVEDAWFSRQEKDRLIRASGNLSQEHGEWSRFLLRGDLAGSSRARKLEEAAAPFLDEVVEPLSERVKRGGRTARVALKTLAHIRVPRSLDAIHDAAGNTALFPHCLAAMSILGGEEAARRALVLARRGEHGFHLASALAAFRGLPGEAVFAFLRECAGDPDLLPAVIMAMEGFAEHDYRALLKPAIRQGDTLVILQAVESLGRMGGAKQARELTTIYRRLESPLVRAGCLNALAETGDPEGAEATLEGLAHEHPVVRAAAVEALISLPVPHKQYRDRVLALLDSDHPRLAMAAAMAALVLDPRKAVQRVGGLLRSGEPSKLLRGIHCLAYMEQSSSGSLLASLIRRSPPGPLRIQGIWALGRRATREIAATEELQRLLDMEDPEVRRRAAWFLAGGIPALGESTVRTLLESLIGEQEAVVTGAYLEAIALTGPVALDAAGQITQYLRHRDPGVRRAAAWALVAGFPHGDEAAELVGSTAPGAAPWGCLRQWFVSGEGLDELAGHIASRDEAEAFEAVQVARLAAEVTSYTSQAANLKGLARALSGECSGESPEEPPRAGAGSRAKGGAPPVAADLRTASTLMDHSPYRPATSAVARIPEQILAPDVKDVQLPTGDDACEALARHPPSVEEAEQAAAEASLFALDRAMVERLVQEKVAARKRCSTDPLATIKIAGFVLLAFLLGQMIRCAMG